jgi:NAD(P)-dependent dehydrogenase (short-subunit alcohol dehydrogenase family)
MELNGQRALITGGALRIGKAICLELAAQGCHIVLHYGRSKAEALETAQAIRALGVDCVLHQADLASSAAVLKLGKAALKAKANILVNSASIFPRVTLEQAKPKDFDEPYAINLRAPALLTQVLGTAWAKAKTPSRIINIADVGAKLGWAGALPYSLSKAGLLQLTRTSAVALAPHVLVNAILPGPIVMPAKHTQAQKDLSLKRSLLGKMGGPGEIAKAVSYLIQSDFVTGAELKVDGGRELAG